ncbi:hypothetical protein [Azospirillum doebereinerae]
MRNLMIGAVSAVLLMTGSAMAQMSSAPATPTYPGSTTSPSAGNSTAGPANPINPVSPGTAGSTGTVTNGSGTSMPGLTTAPSGMGNNTGSNIPRDNQTATGTHCPPGTPNCGPEGSK